MDLNDPLRAKTQGHKKDYYSKEEVHYPIDTRGIVDEWSALQKTQFDQYQQTLKREKEQRLQQQKTYGDELEAVRNLRGQLKKDEIEKSKLQETQQLQAKQHELEQFQKRKVEEEANLKAYLRDSYLTLSDQHKQKLIDEREREKLEDQIRVARSKQSLDDENFKKLLQRAEFNQAQQELMNFRQNLKDQDKNMDNMKKEAYKRMCDENEQKLRDREDQYKQYFHKYNQDLAQRQALHDQVVGEQQRQKTQRMNSWEQNNNKIYQQIAQQKAYQQEQQKLSQKQSCQTWLDMQLSWKDQEKERQKMIVQQEKEVVEKQQHQLREEDKMQKLQDHERKQMYSQALSYQKNLQTLSKQNFGKMTYEEKRINKEDLHHYKDHVPQFDALIPGINNIQSVGAAPLKRMKQREQEKPGMMRLTMSYNDLKVPLSRQQDMQQQLDNTQQFNQSRMLGQSMNGGDIGALTESRLENNITAQSTQYQKGFLQNIISDSNIERHPRKEKIYSKRFEGDQGSYNTITNPIPNYNRNPYLSKVVSRAQLMNTFSPTNDMRRSNVLHNAAMNQMLL